MPQEWTGVLIGRMHNAEITRVELAEELGCTKGYVSLVLCSHKGTSEKVQKKFEAAFERLLEKRRNGNAENSKD